MDRYFKRFNRTSLTIAAMMLALTVNCAFAYAMVHVRTNGQRVIALNDQQDAACSAGQVAAMHGQHRRS
jgi:hypothetical protein